MAPQVDKERDTKTFQDPRCDKQAPLHPRPAKALLHKINPPVAVPNLLRQLSCRGIEHCHLVLHSIDLHFHGGFEELQRHEFRSPKKHTQKYSELWQTDGKSRPLIPEKLDKVVTLSSRTAVTTPSISFSISMENFSISASCPW